MNLEERLLMILRAPYTSEKSTYLADKKNQFTFKVLKDAKKDEIKKAVEHIFSVKVKHVTLMNMQGKRKRFKQTSGKRNDWKKAFVALEDGNNIDFTVTQ